MIALTCEKQLKLLGLSQKFSLQTEHDLPSSDTVLYILEVALQRKPSAQNGLFSGPYLLIPVS